MCKGPEVGISLCVEGQQSQPKGSKMREREVRDYIREVGQLAAGWNQGMGIFFFFFHFPHQETEVEEGKRLAPDHTMD